MIAYTAGFIGFGLIGGSIARAMKSKNPACRLIAYNYRGEENPSLKQALLDGNLDYADTSLDSHMGQCDIIFLCAPVLTNISYLEKLKSIIKPSCILTDAGSVKGNIYEAVKNHGLEQNFIGGHPMAGSEKTGYENSSVQLLENAYYVLTPTNRTPGSMLDTMTGLVADIGAVPIVLDCMEHDDIVAAISHVPHIIAASLVNMIQREDSPDGKMFSLAAGGFKDITRIASSSPEMWQDICLANRKSILKFMNTYISFLEDAASAIKDQDKDGLFDYFCQAKNYRDSIPASRAGMFEKIYELYVDIIDETGAIASLSTLLASNGISIKNIGIIHNREFQEGALRIEFYAPAALKKAADIFTRHHYTIYPRQ